MKNKLVIVISGQVCRENSANLMNFWKGFFNIQNSIYEIDNLKVVAHSWNPEYDELVKNTYSIDYLKSEKQESFVKEYMAVINPIDKFENGLKRFSSTWKSVSPQAILGNARSRSKAMDQVEKINKINDYQILATRWDQGCSGNRNVNEIIFDTSFDKNYLYLSYYSEIDEGYADMWFLAPYCIAKEFVNYDKHVISIFKDDEIFFNKFTKQGWPLSLNKNNRKEKIIAYRNSLFSKIIKILELNVFQKLFQKVTNKIIGLKLRLKSMIEIPNVRGENSLFFKSKTNVVFPNYQALNNHAYLKSFILEKKLREKTRFLDIHDLENIPKGQMINPISFCHLIYSHSSFSDCWEMVVKQAKECLPTNCKKIYLISDDSDETNNKFEKLRNKLNYIELIIYKNEDKYTNRLVKAFNKVEKEFEFIYFIHEDMPLVNKVDKIYLNTLLHFMKNSNEYYIKLVDTTYVDIKEEHTSFPNLVTNKGGYSISVQPSLLKPKDMIYFLKNFNKDIYEFEQVCIRSNFIFSSVKGRNKIGKYLLSNDFFPHIATAIAKGKWCTSEWNEEINFLADKYDIDLSIRGEH